VSENPNRLWTMKDAANFHRVHYGTIKRWKAEGDPRVQVVSPPGRQVRLLPTTAIGTTTTAA
jgi:hypothetical protein